MAEIQTQSELGDQRQLDDFRLPDVRGGEMALTDVLADQRALLVFYRGGWCPLCNRQLSKLSKAYEEFERRGVEILAISNEEVEEGQKALQKIGPPYPLLFDTEGEVLSSLGLVVERRDLWGVLMRRHDYAHPAAMLVDTDRCVQWSYRGKNHRDRPSVQTLLDAIDETERG